MTDAIPPLTTKLIGKTGLRVERRFAASPAQVWRALTDPVLLRRWQSEPTVPMILCEIDLVEGGAFRQIWAPLHRDEVEVSGHYEVLQRPHRIVHTERHAPDFVGEPLAVTTGFTTLGGGTMMTMDFESSFEGRNRLVESGFLNFVAANYSRLDALLRPIG